MRSEHHTPRPHALRILGAKVLAFIYSPSQSAFANELSNNCRSLYYPVNYWFPCLGLFLIVSSTFAKLITRQLYPQLVCNLSPFAIIDASHTEEGIFVSLVMTSQ
ncbi:hypothetical protein HZ326_19660 [Fusarium oxysporum f. sp. albedinis]|nr:hypothetical protein HZ326_19660 [Fusarium oxysporum f. sp. albedinis]